MRRKDREITDVAMITEIIKKCKVCRIALFDEDFPYIIPMNFGLREDNGKIELYFHCANEGKKLDLIRKCNKASFEMDCNHRLITGEKACDFTMEFESVCGNGTIDILSEERKAYALTALMDQYAERKTYQFSDNYINAVTVFRLTVENVWGKKLSVNK